MNKFDFDEFKKKYQKVNVMTRAEILEICEEDFFSSYEIECLKRVVHRTGVSVLRDEIEGDFK